MVRIACFLFAAGVMLAQTADSHVLQMLLAEVRQLRQELNGLTLAAQRTQLLLYRLQVQDEGLKAAEGNLASVRTPAEREGREAQVREMKLRVEMWAGEESNYRAAEATAGSELRAEQAKLFELQQRLDRMEQQLEKPPQSSPIK